MEHTFLYKHTLLWYLVEEDLFLSWKLANSKIILFKNNYLLKSCCLTDRHITWLLFLCKDISKLIMQTVFNFISFLQSILDICMHIWIPLLQNIILI